MSRSLWGGPGHAWCGPVVGWRVFVPGLAQRSWGQNARGAVLLGWFLSAVLAALFAWGTPVGLALIAFAFGTHAYSVADALRQAAFPGLGRWAPWVTAAGWLACGLYVPTLAAVSLLAWPVAQKGDGADGYLVNCWAYRQREPVRGEWVWFQSPAPGGSGLGRVIAEAGQEVEWARNRLKVDGGLIDLPAPARSSWPPQAISYRVPEGHVLVDSKGGRNEAEGLVIIDRERVVGRAWARYYPVLERRLLD